MLLVDGVAGQDNVLQQRQLLQQLNLLPVGDFVVGDEEDLEHGKEEGGTQGEERGALRNERGAEQRERAAVVWPSGHAADGPFCISMRTFKFCSASMPLSFSMLLYEIQSSSNVPATGSWQGRSRKRFSRSSRARHVSELVSGYAQVPRAT